jgi:choline-sulfatase
MEYLAEAVHAPLVMLVKGSHKLIRCPGDPDMLFDLAADPLEQTNLIDDPAYALVYREMSVAIDRRWSLGTLHREVLASQARRRLVAHALAIGRIHAWEHPTPDGASGRYLRTGDDFWSTHERRRLP